MQLQHCLDRLSRMCRREGSKQDKSQTSIYQNQNKNLSKIHMKPRFDCQMRGGNDQYLLSYFREYKNLDDRCLKCVEKKLA